MGCPKCKIENIVCVGCLRLHKQYKKTKEWDVVKYLRKHVIDYEFIHNKSVGNNHLFSV
jgi:hypothetical protein